MTVQHFAGINHHTLADATQGKAALVSFADVMRNRKLWSRDLLPRLQDGHWTSCILDSGAFTELRVPGFHVDLVEYGQFVVEYGHLFSQCITLDDIGGDLARTWNNTKQLLDMGANVVPVFHGREPWSVLRHYCERFDQVAIGFARDRGRIAKDQGDGLTPDEWLEGALDVIAPHGNAVHGLGMTRYALDHGHTLDTVDSTTWIAEFKGLSSAGTNATHSVNGRAQALLADADKPCLLRLAVVSRVEGEGADDDTEHLAHGAKGQARTCLRRLAGTQLVAHLEQHGALAWAS